MKKCVKIFKMMVTVGLVMLFFSFFSTDVKASELEESVGVEMKAECVYEEVPVTFYDSSSAIIYMMDPTNDQVIGYVELFLDFDYSDGSWVEVTSIRCNVYVYDEYWYIEIEDVDEQHYIHNGYDESYGMRRVTLKNIINDVSVTTQYYFWVDYYGEVSTMRVRE